MNVLVIGEGGREDALVWALTRSGKASIVRCLPGSAGIARRVPCVPIAAADIDGIVRHVTAEAYDLVVIGPEGPLVAGLGDRLRAAGIAVFGPSAAAAEIEGSKVFSKEFMARHGIPTAAFRIFDRSERARAYLESSEATYPLVLKADGLAAGKGVMLVDDARAAIDGAQAMLSGDAFGSAGRRIVIEQKLAGREVSYFALCDGERFVELATCQDYKRALDQDLGPNTGGMGSYSPSVHLDDATRTRIAREIADPTLRALAAEGRPFRGVLYVGLMLTENGPMVLEYNARFGDPETQALLPRLDGDWLELLYAAATTGLQGVTPRFAPGAAVCVVLASGGYPGAFASGAPIEGLSEAESREGVVVFHAGTQRRGDQFVTKGGRVLGVTALGADLASARERAYDAADRIRFKDMHVRRDIALDAVRAVAGGTHGG